MNYKVDRGLLASIRWQNTSPRLVGGLCRTRRLFAGCGGLLGFSRDQCAGSFFLVGLEECCRLIEAEAGNSGSGGLAVGWMWMGGGGWMWMVDGGVDAFRQALDTQLQ